MDSKTNMTKFAQVAQSLNSLADETWTTPDDVLRTATDRGDSFEMIVETFDEPTRRAVADANECADVFAAAQRLKGVVDERVAAFQASLIDVVEARCRAVEAEYDALIGGKHGEGGVPDERAVEALERERAGKVDGVRGLLDMRDVERLLRWTGKARAAIIYDSAVDEFTDGGLFNAVQGKPNIALIGFTTDGDVFGGFHSVAVTEQDKAHDPSIFFFSFESHGRCMTPQRFGVKEPWRTEASVEYHRNLYFGRVGLWGDAGYGFSLGDERYNTFCSFTSMGFKEVVFSTFPDKTRGANPLYFRCTRIVAVQLE